MCVGCIDDETALVVDEADEGGVVWWGIDGLK
jgi:hypothetical protein